MLKKILALLLMLYAAASFAAVDVNKASQPELDGIRGIGPTMSKRIVDERKKGAFKNWADLIDRVKGMGEINAGKFSAEGLTVNGTSYKPAAAKQDRKDDKAAAKQDKKDAAKDTKPAAKPAAKEDKKDAKSAAKKDDAAAPAKK